MKSNLLIISTALVFLSGCASTLNKFDLNTININEDKPKAEKTVFYSNNNLSDADVNKILNSKITLPRNIKIAIVKLQPKTNDDSYYSYRLNKNTTNLVQNESVNYLNSLFKEIKTTRNNKISTANVPESLIPPNADIKAVRNLGTIMQADLVLVIDSKNDLNSDLQVYKAGIAKGVTSADTYLIDTRTGIVLVTNSYTNEAFVEKTNKDFDAYQTMERAKIESEKKIYKILAADISTAIETRR